MFVSCFIILMSNLTSLFCFELQQFKFFQFFVIWFSFTFILKIQHYTLNNLERVHVGCPSVPSSFNCSNCTELYPEAVV